MGKVVAIVNTLVAIGYPFAVYFGLTHLRPRGVGLLLLLLLAPSLIAKAHKARREDLRALLRVPLSIASLLLLAALLDDRRIVLALPVLINLVLLLTFAASLRGVPMVERFARMQEPELGPAQVAYCRTVTRVWCGFFVLNGALSGALALWAPLSLWTLYTGLIAYLLIGLLGAGEYVVRKARFREYGAGLHDRLLAKLFPPPAVARES